MSLSEQARELAGKIDRHIVSVDEPIWYPTSEAPALLRQLADENERLQDGSLRQYLTDQNTQLREQLVIVCDENEHLQREIERLQRVVEQAIRVGGVQVRNGLYFGQNANAYDAEEVPDLAQELKEAQ